MRRGTPAREHGSSRLSFLAALHSVREVPQVVRGSGVAVMAAALIDRLPHHCQMLVATVSFPFVAAEKVTPWRLLRVSVRSTLLTTSTARGRDADTQMGNEDVAEALPGTGGLEGGVVVTLRCEPAHDPRVGGDG